MKPIHLLRALTVALAVLFTCISPTWAWNYTVKGRSDAGGGTYDFRYTQQNFTYGNTTVSYTDMMSFESVDGSFDATNANFDYEFKMRIIFQNLMQKGDKELKNVKVDGEIYVVLGDDKTVRIATYTKNSGVAKNLTYSFEAHGEAFFEMKSQLDNYGYMTVKFQPQDYFLDKGLKAIYFKNRLVYKNAVVFDDYQYEKPLDTSSWKNVFPQLQFTEWTPEGNIVFKASLNKNSRWDLRAYEIELPITYSYSNSHATWHKIKLWDPDGPMTVTTTSSSVDVTWMYETLKSYWPDIYPFTSFYRANTRCYFTLKDCIGYDMLYYAPLSPVNVIPYTRPETVTTEFDKWNQKVLVKWTKRNSASYYDEEDYRTKTVDCKLDGRWYVMRYDKGADLDEGYHLVGSIKGNSSNLQLTDNGVDYGHDYVYRVVFLPDILVDAYAEKLTQIPRRPGPHNSNDLYEEATISTLLDVPIRLTQDRTFESGIKLSWEYSVQKNGCEWRIDKRRLGETTWKTLTTLPVEKKNSVATFEDNGEEGGALSPCDFYVYRIRTEVNGQEFFSDTLSANLPGSTYIKEVTATTGVHPDHVVVTWKVEQRGSDDTWFSVLRRPLGSTNDEDWVLLTNNISGTKSEYEYSDDRVMAGSYYEYTVQAFGLRCDEQVMQKTDQKTAPGFSSARGIISGHIAYGSGTSVSGVQVNLVKSSADESSDAPQFLSRFIDGEGVGLSWKGNSETIKGALTGQHPHTLQLWVKPQSSEGAVLQSLLKLTNSIELALQSDDGVNYQLYVNDVTHPIIPSTTLLSDLTLSADQFSHVAVVYDGKSNWTFYVGNDTLRSMTLRTQSEVWDALEGEPYTLSIGGSNHKIGTAFSGFVDDVRLWERALTRQEIERNYTRILGGTEKGLILYWPMDEGINVRDYMFDVACKNGLYQLNHAVVGANALPSAVVPDLLKLYGETDDEGDYLIRGIPFQQGGTNYKVVPDLGIHQFSPNNRSLFVSPTSLTGNNIDFEDVSSFPMEGYIYYAGTNIPAEGLMISVDGIVQSKEGKLIQTDANGHYLVSVPIGEHFVEASLEGHKMVDGGRFPAAGYFNFDRAVTHNFTDSTLVNLVGRVGGGEKSDTLAVGFGASTNNIGMATITLKLNNESFSFNCQDDLITSATTNRTWESDTTSIASRSWTGTGYDAKYIYIRTDSLTGEFSAMVPPLKYITKSITIDSNPDIEFLSLPDLDLSSPSRELKDSLKVELPGGDSQWKYYTYNTKFIRSHFAAPQVKVQETANPEGAFGHSYLADYEISNSLLTETIDIDDIWTQEEDGSITYRFGYPIYEKGDSTVFTIAAYESYVNYDGSKRGKILTENIPLTNQSVIIKNEMSSKQSVVYKQVDPDSEYQPGMIYEMKDDEVTLGADGKVEYRWRVGQPNIVSPYTRHFTVTMNRNGRIYVPAEFDAVILGGLPEGNNFVTKGPDHIHFVLRDPPGAKSRTTLKTGDYKVRQKATVDAGYGNEKLVFEQYWGLGGEVVTGAGLMIISSSSAEVVSKEGFHAEWEVGHKDGYTYNSSFTETISTGGAYPYVGSAGDVYVGVASNLLFGNSRNVCITRKLKDGPLVLDVEDCISVGSELTTSFKYSQYELEEVMIPKWKDLRNRFLTQVPDSIYAQTYVNNSDHSVYLTWLSPDNPNYGVSGYSYIHPEDLSKIDKEETDSVIWYNNQIEQWESVIADNEKDKLECIKNKKKYVNFSIDGGSTYEYSDKTDSLDVKYEHSHFTNWKLGGIGSIQSGAHKKDVTKIGFGLTIDTENGRQYNDSYTYSEGKITEWTYHVEDGNRDTDLSINKYESDKCGYGDFFSIYGGQTYNPYEGAEVTHQYNPGTPLGNATVQMEQPNLQISLGDGTPGKNLTVTDIPSGQKVNLVLTCTNLGTANQGKEFSFDLFYVEKSDTAGLQIFMDGYPMNGRPVYLPRGETIKKIITINQTDESILDYEGIKLRFASQHQPLKIYDEVTLNAHFMPSSSPVDLAVDEPVLNQEVLGRNKGQLKLKLENFNRQFKNLRYVGVQYRYAGNTQWNTIHTYVTNPKDTINSSYTMLPDAGVIRYDFDMSNDNFFPQGTYTFRAFTTTPYGTSPNDAATVYSEEVTVVKDNVSPRALTTPTPSDGILNYGEDLSVEFNEDIVPGYVGDKNVIVTAKLNHQSVNHEVSKLLWTEDQRTVNPIFLNGDFSIDFWFKWESEGSLLQLGKGNTPFMLSVDAEGHIVATIGGSTFVSKKSIPKKTWAYVVMSYKSADMTFSALTQYDTTSEMLFEDQTVDPDATQAIVYTDDNHLYLGDSWAYMHDLSLFNVYRDVHDAASAKYEAKDNYVYGLVNYWPMNEGHGSVAADMRHTHDFEVFDYWEIDNPNYTIYMRDEQGAEADISRINTSRGESYAIELWVENNAERTGEQTVFETGTTLSNRLRLYYDASHNLMLDYGETTKQLYSSPSVQEYSGWHHLALNVLRGQAASFYYDGQRTAVIAEADVPPMEGAKMKLGKNIDCIDEVRIWKAALSENRLLSNMYNCIDTADVYSRGLVAYYPLEKKKPGSTLNSKVFTLENMAPLASPSDSLPQLVVLASYSKEQQAPPLKNAPDETQLIASPVASERKVVINLTGAGISQRDIEGTTLNITLADIRDMHGNSSEPIKWTAYVQQNTLRWTKDSVNIIKEYGDEYTFDVNIENKGGTIEYYSLYNMPHWLSLVDSERNDDVSPMKTKTLRFRVDPLVAVGNYDITIGLQGNKEVLEPLRIVMKVSGQKPDWAVDPTKYDHHMSIVGQVYINGILMENAESMVAAFIGNECRGVASPDKVRGAAYVQLNIYGIDAKAYDRGKEVSFRIWDASKGVAYTDAQIAVDGKAASIVFGQDQMIGNFDQPAIWTKSNHVEQLIPVHENWNWMAFGVEPKSSYLDLIFSSLADWKLLIKNRDTWSDYNGAQWNGTLVPRVNEMYKLKVEPLPRSGELPAQIAVSGTQLPGKEMPVTLNKGWNWIAYTPLATMTVGEALAAANPQKGDIVKSQTGMSIYGIYGWEGNLQALESGHGYMYYSTDATAKSFVYPDAPSASSRMAAPRRAPEALQIFTPVDRYLYPNNMTMAIQLKEGAAVVDTAEVAAFVGDECRGATRANSNGLYYLVIAGEGAGQPIILRTYIDGEVIDIDDTQQFVSDANIGTSWEPYVIDLLNPSVGVTKVTIDDATDDDDWWTLQGIKLMHKPTQPGVYIHRGQRVSIGIAH